MEDRNTSEGGKTEASGVGCRWEASGDFTAPDALRRVADRPWGGMPAGPVRPGCMGEVTRFWVERQ